MTVSNLKNMSVDQLLQRFTSIAIDQDWAIFHEDNTKYNSLYGEMDEIRNELKSRPGDQRRALVRLFGHPNIQVRLKAARTALELVPNTARPVLQSIADSRCYPQAADALLALWRLDGTSPVKA